MEAETVEPRTFAGDIKGVGSEAWPAGRQRGRRSRGVSIPFGGRTHCANDHEWHVRAVVALTPFARCVAGTANGFAARTIHADNFDFNGNDPL